MSQSDNNRINYLIDKIINLAIEEDINTGDITTSSIIPQSAKAVATMTAKADGVISGIEIVEKVFRKFQNDIRFTPFVSNGSFVRKGDAILKIEGSYPALLTGERTALNFFQRMSGIATETAKYVACLEGTHTKLLDTRKTAPGMRITDKMAVKDGGGTNHRMGLYDLVMIKDNHIKMAGSITAAVSEIRSKVPPEMRIEVETTNLDEVHEALASKADIIMLDNMSTPMMAEAVRLTGGKAETEASGNMSLERLHEVASTGVDYISVGALTHTVKALDISMNITQSVCKGTETKQELIEAIQKLKIEKKALILAHYYSDPDVQDVCDFVGDSLELARKAATTDAEIIVFCGVHFMAETAAIISPSKKVLIPVLGAGCSLADGVSGSDLRKWRAENPDGVVISYVNTTAEVKSETDICCTSANAVKVADSVYKRSKGPVLFVPDNNLGSYINRTAGFNMSVWQGNCFVHKKITDEMVESMMLRYPEAEVLIHPESECVQSEDIMNNPRCFFYSTSGIIRHVRESSKHQFIIATEVGVLHKIRKECPDKEAIPISPDIVCRDMKKCTLQSLFESLLYEQHRVVVPPSVASRALAPIQKMLEL